MSFLLKDCVGLELSGRYVVREKLGDGGMGTVYRAYDRNLETDVVIKVPHPAMFQQAGFEERFGREIRSLVAHSHPHIVKITDVGEHEGLPYAVMQYLASGSLEDRRPRDGKGNRLPERADQLASWLMQIATALDFVHGQGLVHRDVKPANLLFDEDGNAYLSDFGIAKVLGSESNPRTMGTLTGTGLVIGTPEYMAPEVINGEPYDGRADQYALAATVYELLSGRRPFEAATPAAVLVKQATQSPPDLAELNSAIPRPVASAIQKALSKQPKQRFASCRAFATAVILAVGEEHSDTTPPKKTSRQSQQGSADGAEGPSMRDTAEMPQIQVATSRTSLPERGTCAKRKANTPAAIWSLWNSFDHMLANIAGEGNTLLHHFLRWVTLGAGILAIACTLVLWPNSDQPPDTTAKLVVRDAQRGDNEPDLERKESKDLSLASQSPVLDGPKSQSVHITPDRPQPDLAEVPFDTAQAKTHQAKWASYLGNPVDVTNSIGMELTLIPPGKYKMGSPADEGDIDDDDETQVDVTLTHPFRIGKTEVTQSQWQSVMGRKNKPWYGSAYVRDGEQFPAVWVRWYDALEFCNRLSVKEGIAPYYRLTDIEKDKRSENDIERIKNARVTVLGGPGYCLPTEAQWEWACRAGSDKAYSFGDDQSMLGRYAWFYDNASKMEEEFAHAVATKLPNGFDLYDMHGNASEWCLDVYRSMLPGGRDPRELEEDSYRVQRGDTWNSSARHCRSAKRFKNPPYHRGWTLGFRVVRVPQAEQGN